MKRSVTTAILIGACFCVAPAPQARQAQQSPIVQAMQEEMTRAMNGLRLPNEPPPYYVAYLITESASEAITATLGSLISEYSSRSRTLRVEVRVGDYNLDSSRFQALSRDPGMLSMYGQFALALPLDDDYAVMRREMWLATDGAYKRAVQTLAKKKAAAQTLAAEPNPIPDFSRETPAQTFLPASPLSPKLRGWLEDVKRISSVFLKHPDIDSSNVSIGQSQGMRYFLNSEGFKVVEPIRSASFQVGAGTQAIDGMALRDYIEHSGRTVDDLPSAADLLARTEALASSLTALRLTKVGDEFTGPVLVEGQASPALMSTTLVPLFLSQRAPEMESTGGPPPRFPTPPFLNRIGSRVLPESFSVNDTPSVKKFGDAVVIGSYAVDDDGVPAQDVALVKDGRLLTLLTGRTPQKDLLRSNGHGRTGNSQAGVFQMESSKAVPASELKPRYLELLKQQSRPFGYIVRTVSRSGVMPSFGRGGAGGAQLGPQILSVVKVLPDGTEQAVRGLVFANVQYTTFKNILEASRERTLYSTTAVASSNGIPTLPGGTSMMAAMISLIVPSVIFEEVEIQAEKGPAPKPPIVPSPLKK
ncbi:MAG: metallopeptidase TldD-related protein [Acidobacteria bacterium]|nr:metallopeptidase TldD-related protein [Acidobacteriota bacterium]